MRNHIALKSAIKRLAESDKEFRALFTHGSLEVEFYKPEIRDKQQPHTRDEIYVIAGGTSDFVMEGERTFCKPGDFLFVPAGAVHRFVDFSDDFSTWVFFYGPEGGEQQLTE